MKTTKEKIMLTALQLFALDGYEAVSVGRIAKALSLSKGAMYRHFRSKRDLFDRILQEMEKRDAAGAEAFCLPAGRLEEMESAYRESRIEAIASYGYAQFCYWTEDPFASAFRRMLTIEQFRNAELNAVYQQYLGTGPLGYLTDLFGSLGVPDAKERAEEFYAPMVLYYSLYDGAGGKDDAVHEIKRRAEAHFARQKELLLREKHDRNGEKTDDSVCTKPEV